MSNFEQVVKRFNELAFLNKHKIAELQLLRKELHSLKIVREKTIFGFDPKKEDYTFHYGGNKEFQFNFGTDYNFKKDKSTVFRYGIAFSIERNPHFFNPEDVFRPKVEIFNRFLFSNKEYFKNYLMYIHRNNNEVERFNVVQKVQDKDTFPNTFIFIGNYLDKQLDEITDSDIETMLKSFDYLLEVYKYVESNKENETRIARICWNTNGWIKPSGKKGKSKSHSHEYIYGFGHEEWNFDTEKIINGYK
jgi:hypothetical protein